MTDARARNANFPEAECYISIEDQVYISGYSGLTDYGRAKIRFKSVVETISNKMTRLENVHGRDDKSTRYIPSAAETGNI